MIYHMLFFSLPFESNLAIQNASFTIPDEVQSDRKFLKITRYCLEKDVCKRPDIYQVSTLIFDNTPIQNVNNKNTPNIAELKLPLTESQAERLKQDSRKTEAFQQNHKNTTIKININPRQRPEETTKKEPPSAEAIIAELQKRSTDQQVSSAQVYNILEKMLPSLNTAGDRVKANKKNTDLVSKKYSELANLAKNDAKALEQFKPHAEQLAACYHNQQAQLNQSIQAYKQIHQKVQVLQELYAKLKGQEDEIEKAFDVGMNQQGPPEIFTAEFPEFDENQKPVENTIKINNNENSPVSNCKTHRRTRSETPITELAKLRLEQAKNNNSNCNSNSEVNNLLSSDNFGAFEINPNNTTKDRSNTLPTTVSGDTYQNLQRDLFKNQNDPNQEISPFDCVPGFTDSFSNDNNSSSTNKPSVQQPTVDLFGAAPF